MNHLIEVVLWSFCLAVVIKIVDTLLPDNMLLEIIFEPRDLWIGVYWDWDSMHVIPDGADLTLITVADIPVKNSLDVYVCVVPILPIHFHWESK